MIRNVPRLLLVVLCVGCGESDKLHPIANQFGYRYLEICEQTRGDFPPDGRLSSELPFFDAMSKKCEEKAQSLSGDQAKLFSATTLFYVEGASLIGKYVNASQKLEAAGGLDFIKITSNATQGSLIEHLSLVRNVSNASERINEFEAAANEEFRDRLIASKIEVDVANDCMIVFESVVTSEQRDKFRALDDDFNRAAKGALRLLIDKWGRWSINPQSGAISFEDASVKSDWKEFASKMAKAKSQSAKIKLD